ncbi:MAG: hypothetical protein ACFCVD_01255 [Nodosilinea sp.]
MTSTPYAGVSAATAAIKPFLAGAFAIAILGLVIQGQGLGQRFFVAGVDQSQDCKAIVQRDAQLSREQLAQLLTIPERDAKAAVRKIVSEPFCKLPELQVRSGVTSEREAYPLAFDPNTQLVILYENDEYAGYRFKFH